MILAIHAGGGGWLLRAACAAAAACALAIASCSAWYWAMPSDSSDVHCCTCAFWAAWVRLALDWLRAEVRSYELSWVTAALEVAAGCPTCGRITVARTTLQTTTALSSGITLTLLLESALPLGRCSGLSVERRRLEGGSGTGEGRYVSTSAATLSSLSGSTTWLLPPRRAGAG